MIGASAGKRYFEFETLVAEILAQRSKEIKQNVQLRGERIREIDIQMTNRDGTVTPVEVKITLGRQVRLSRLRDISSRAASLQPFAKGSKPLLVVSAAVDPSNRAWAENEFSISILDRDDLIRTAGSLKSDAENWFAKLDAEYESNSPDFPKSRASRWDAENSSVEDTAAEELPDPPAALQGEALKGRLLAVKRGKPQAKDYEKICQDIIAYIFGDDLRDGRSQKRTEDGLNIYDLIYRVNPKHPFWITLTRDFRARAILFECKNYNKAIGPPQVFMTERYLSTNALRPICFVLTRLSPNQHAKEAAFGAMRDSGKLLVFLSDDDLVQMIDAKDTQISMGGNEAERLENDPTEVLDQKIYDFIAAMPR